MNCFSSFVFVFTLFLAATRGFALGQEESGPGNSWTVETVLGETYGGNQLRIENNRVVLNTDSEREFPLDEIVSIGTEKKIATETVPGTQLVRFTTGGELRCNVNSITAESAEVGFQGANLSIKLESVSAIVWNDSPELQQMLSNPTDKSDRVVVKGAEGIIAVEGIFESLDATRLSIQYQGQARTMPRERVDAIVPARIGEPAAVDRSTVLTLDDGSTVGGRLEKMGAENAEMQLLGSQLTFPVSKIVSLQFKSDRVQRLAELEPVDTTISVMFAPNRGWQRNLSVEGNPITLKVNDTTTIRKFRSGIGTQANSRLSFSNEKDFDRLRGLVGIDVETDGRGDCVVVVRGDGIQLWTARLQGNGPAMAVDVDVSGMKVVELIVEAGAQFDLGDHVDWADIRLIRTR